jgi:cytochrome c oxidase cbb3-type subunit 3
MDHHYWTAQAQDAPPRNAQSQNAQSQNAQAQSATSESGVPAPSRLAPIVQGPLGPVPGPMRGTERVVPNPYQGDPAAMLEGRRMFVAMNCSGCHGGHAGGGMGPSLRDEVWIYGNRPMDIFDSISNGRANGMPAWGTMLPQQQIWQIVAYIQSMRTPQEPEPPE